MVLEYELAIHVVQYAGLDDLVRLRGVSRAFREVVDRPPPAPAFAALPIGFDAYQACHFTWAVLAAMRERRCSVCGESYRGACDATFGVFAHSTCRRTMLVRGEVEDPCLYVKSCRTTRVAHSRRRQGTYPVVWGQPHWSVPRPACPRLGHHALQHAIQHLADTQRRVKRARWDGGQERRTTQRQAHLTARAARCQVVYTCVSPEQLHAALIPTCFCRGYQLRFASPTYVRLKAAWLDVNRLVVNVSTYHDWRRLVTTVLEQKDMVVHRFHMSLEDNRSRLAARWAQIARSSTEPEAAVAEWCRAYDRGPVTHWRAVAAVMRLVTAPVGSAARVVNCECCSWFVAQCARELGLHIHSIHPHKFVLVLRE